MELKFKRHKQHQNKLEDTIRGAAKSLITGEVTEWPNPP